MIAIQTKYLRATNTKGARIKAWATGRPWSATIPYDHSKNHELPYFEAVKTYLEKHKFECDIQGMRFGSVKNGYVFCFNQSIVEGSL